MSSLGRNIELPEQDTQVFLAPGYRGHGSTAEMEAPSAWSPELLYSTEPSHQATQACSMRENRRLWQEVPEI